MSFYEELPVKNVILLGKIVVPKRLRTGALADPVLLTPVSGAATSAGGLTSTQANALISLANAFQALVSISTTVAYG